MFHFLSRLIEATPTPRAPRRRERRPALRVEGLETRVVLSGSSLHPIHFPLLDPIQLKYQALGGPGGFLGKATTPEQNTPYGGGRYQLYQHGAIYWSSKTGAHDFYGGVESEYFTTALEHDAYGTNVQQILGLPTADEGNVSGVAGARTTPFQGGAIYWSKGTGAHVVYGAIWGDYKALAKEHDAGGRVAQLVVGLPTSDEMDVSWVSGARMNTFQGGNIYWSPGTGAHVVYGAIGGEYQATAGEVDFYGNNVQPLIGLPTSDEAAVPGQPGGRVSTFQNGAIYWSPATGAHVIYGAIYGKFSSLGGPSWFGLPTTDETTTPDGTGRYNHFETVGPSGGALAAIDWTPATGAREVHGAIATEFASQGWEAGLGEAITDEIDIASFTYFGAYNRFQQSIPFLFGPIQIRTAIDYTPGGGASVVHAPQYGDIAQGDHGTCWIDASIAELEDRGVDLSQLITYQGSNWYTVNLYNFNDSNNRQGGGMHADTQWVYFDGSTYGADLHWNSSDPAQSWALIMQRAVIQAVAEWDPSQSIQNPHGGSATDALPILTGRTSQWAGVNDSNVQQTIANALAAGQAVDLCTIGSGTQTLVANHCYAVLSTDGQGVTLYNPWGSSLTVSWSVVQQDGDAFAIC